VPPRLLHDDDSDSGVDTEPVPLEELMAQTVDDDATGTTAMEKEAESATSISESGADEEGELSEQERDGPELAPDVEFNSDDDALLY
jgi:hypothetical protein